MSNDKHKTITYYINAEPQETVEHKRAVRAMLSEAGFSPPDDYRLIRDDGEKELGLDEIVPVHNGERFTALFRGPTPTS